ncbi:hypothetical protein AB0L40_11820 [Patulibacter sp. NPDC049589]|uniref:hypothetical protein n=1 Tax=Patulibacter sp. NPDC049589 TaxID=3154731 RepID=UPI0034179850
MSTDDDPSLDPGEQALADRLAAEQPLPSTGLRRRVRGRIGLALQHRALRRRSAGLVLSGSALLALALVLALNVPS